ncbi:CLUMA_CG017460, isoform A [Clunio marinus]|uniref:CLUMA_CG017460, isoform A n=1 Tax=Clunio marinus TaxID=568069 RepID=A0A1J1IW17_9DIPT|nr:CLUMA_CG017460, isoform A [Clunio marinus]
MTDAREIITLQFGNFANHVGCHFWNIQENSFNYDPTVSDLSEINHDVLFREGTHNRNITYTPRMLLVDLKGTLKYIPESGNLYNQPLELNNPDNSVLDQVRSTIQWDEDFIEVMETEPVEVPEFQKSLQQNEVRDNQTAFNLKETIRDWPDFMYTRYHPKSINIIKEYERKDEVSTLDTFTAGSQLFETPFFEDDFCDNIRSFMEECNHSQGFQTFFDCIDGFSGVALKCMEHLEDEYSKPIFAIPLFPCIVKNFQFADEAMSDSIRMINIASSFAKLSEHSNLFTPLSTMGRAWRTIDEPRKFPSLNYDPSNIYHSSAILATFMDTMSLKYRLKDSSLLCSLSGFCSELNGYNRKMSAAKLAMPFPMNEKEDLIDFLDRFDGSLMESITPGVTVGNDRIVQSISLRGVPKSRLKRPLESAKSQMKMSAYKCTSISEMIQLYYQCNTYASLSNVAAIESRMKVKSPFPKEFFDDRIAVNGFMKEFQNSIVEDIKELPVMTALQTSNEISNVLENLHTNVSRVKIAKVPRLVDSGLEVVDYKETLEQLLTFKEQYDESFFL